MIKIPYEQVIKIIENNSDLSHEDIEKKIKEKLDQLSGLISKEGASHILANELGINLMEKTKGRTPLGELLQGMRNIEVHGKITAIYEVREFTRNERTGKVGSFMIADETGRARIVCWGSQADKIKDLEEGMTLKVSDAYSKKNTTNNFIEIHLNEQAKIEVNPKDITIEIQDTDPTPSIDYIRKNISQITPQDTYVQLLGFVVQIFPPNFYEICPTCGKRAKQEGQGNVCPVHGIVEPSYSYVLNFTLDDGTENEEDVRFVCFREQVEKLLQKNQEAIQQLRSNPEQFTEIKQEILGRQIMIQGRSSKNENFNRIEIIVQSINNSPDPQKELQRIESTAN